MCIIITPATSSSSNTPNINAEATNEEQESFQGQPHSSTTDTVQFMDDGFVNDLSGEEQSFLDEFCDALPDEPNKSIQTVFSRWSMFKNDNLVGVNSGSNGVFKIQDMITKHCAYHKLDGYYGFTASFSCKVTWNTPPTVQGAFILAYVPPGVAFPQLAGGDGVFVENVFLSGCPHVIINLAESTSAELTIPYVGPSTFIPISHEPDFPLLGWFVLRSLVTPRSTTDITDLRYTMYFCMKDLKTFGTYPSVADLKNGTLKYGQVYSQSSEAVEKDKQISKITGQISSFIKKAGEYIPPSIVPKSYVDGASWAVGGVSKIADLLGFSKPYSLEPAKPRFNISYRDTTVADANFGGAKFAMNSDAGIKKYDLSGRGVDEMQISEVLSRPNIMPLPTGTDFAAYTRAWKADQAIGAEIVSIDCVPANFVGRVTIDSTACDVNTQMSYLSQFFGKWRGSLVVGLIPVCTKFHSGRLRVTYNPAAVGTKPTDCLAYSYSNIIDIRDSATWQFEIPFISDKPWKDTLDSSGQIRILVETPLMASSGALAEIDIMCTIKAGPTFELAIPSLVPGVLPLFSKKIPKENAPVHSQAGLPRFVTKIEKVQQLAPDMGSSSEVAHAMAVGDPVRSLRSMCKKFWTSRDPIYESSKAISTFPFPINVQSKTDYGEYDMIALLAPLFAYWRGGFRTYAQNYYPVRVATEYKERQPQNIAVNSQAHATMDYESLSTFTSIGTNEASKIEVPYTFGSVCRNTFMTSTDGERIMALVHEYYLGNPGAIIQRAMADDFDMGTLVGAPVTRLISPGAANNKINSSTFLTIPSEGGLVV